MKFVKTKDGHAVNLERYDAIYILCGVYWSVKAEQFGCKAACTLAEFDTREEAENFPDKLLEELK